MAVALIAISRHKILTRQYGVFFIYFIVAAVADIALFLKFNDGKNNLPVINLFAFLQTVLLAMGFYISARSRAFRSLLSIALILITAMVLYRMVIQNVLSRFDSLSITIQGIFIMIIAGYTLLSLSKDLVMPLFKNPLFWISVSAFIYFTVNTAVFCTVNFKLDQKQGMLLMRYTWLINLVMSIVSNILYSIGLLCIQKKKPWYLP